jgi:hypothetical protein
METVAEIVVDLEIEALEMETAMGETEIEVQDHLAPMKEVQTNLKINTN